MTSADFEQEVPVSAYGQQRRAAWLAGLRANADAMTAAAMQAHEADHNTVTAGQGGLYGSATPQQMAAMVAARTATVGSDYGGRPLERNGGLYDHAATGPAPARVDLRFVDRPQPTGESPTMRWARERNQ